MQFGIAVFPTDEMMGVGDLARAVESHGFESIWFPEHTHIPAARVTPWPGGDELPRHYTRLLDPFVALGVAAAATSTLKLATGICLVPQRDPLITAKQVATLDHVSEGRVLFGVGAGWNREELENHGVDYDTRFRVMRERIEAMKLLWTEDEATYSGRHVAFERVWSWPKPVQRPHPPIVVAGAGPNVLARVVAYGDGWLPIHGRGSPIEERIPELLDLAARAGRDPIPVSLFHAPADLAEIERLAAVGVTRFIFGVPTAPAEVILPQLAGLAALVATLRG